jgi:hypothetical protein
VALCFGGMTALIFFRLEKLAPDETVLINGASGAVGTMAVQLAKHLGAEVIAVCSGANVELVRGLGADHVLDYTTEDFTRNGQRYDVIMDNHGNTPYSRVKGLLSLTCERPGRPEMAYRTTACAAYRHRMNHSQRSGLGAMPRTRWIVMRPRRNQERPQLPHSVRPSRDAYACRQPTVC